MTYLAQKNELKEVGQKRTQEPRKAKTNGPSDRGHFNGLDRLDSKNRVYSAETSAPRMRSRHLNGGWGKINRLYLQISADGLILSDKNDALYDYFWTDMLTFGIILRGIDDRWGVRLYPEFDSFWGIRIPIMEVIVGGI